MSQPKQQQNPPGVESELRPAADHGESSYRGSGRLAGKAAVITGADSGIGKAVAIAFAREGADVLISYLDEHDDAEDTKKWVEDAGRKAVLAPGDLADPAYCREIIATAVGEFGRVDVLVNNAAFQMSHDTLEEIADEEWDHTMAINLSAMFHLCKAAVPHMRPGSSIIGSSSVNSDTPQPPACALCGDQGRYRQHGRKPGPAAGGEGNPRQQRRTRTDLDPVDPRDHARGEGGELRPAGPDGSSRAAR